MNPTHCDKPVIASSRAEPGTRNVLSAFVFANVSGADSVIARYGVGTTLDNTTPAFTSISESSALPVLGLYASTSYHAQLIAMNACGSTAGDVVSFSTGGLPSDIPSYRASGISPQSGYIVFAAGNYGIVIDNSGRIVWYHHFPNGPGLNFQAQPNGRYTARPPSSAGQIAKWIELDPLGDTTRALTCGRNLQPRLHDMIARPDGSYWMICDEVRTIDLSAQGRSSQSRVTGAVVQKLSPSGDVLFEWNVFDHFEVDLSVLEPTEINGVSVNWTHGNALDLDGDGNLLVSFRNLNEIAKIDTQTGAVIWRLGGKQNQFTFENVLTPAFRHQHGIRAAGTSRVLLLDNLGESSGSRMELYEIDEVHRTARLIRSNASSAGLVAFIGGSTQSLSGGNTLVSFGNGGGVEEYNQAGSAVWRIDGSPGYIFRAQRIKSLYSPGFGDPR